MNNAGSGVMVASESKDCSAQAHDGNGDGRGAGSSPASLLAQAAKPSSPAVGSMTDTERLNLIEDIFRNETVSFSFMRFVGWEANKPWICDRHNFGYKRWHANTLRELIDGLAAEYQKSLITPPHAEAGRTIA